MKYAILIYGDETAGANATPGTTGVPWIEVTMLTTESRDPLDMQQKQA
jgi:hypothetical protein